MLSISPTQLANLAVLSCESIANWLSIAPMMNSILQMMMLVIHTLGNGAA